MKFASSVLAWFALTALAFATLLIFHFSCNLSVTIPWWTDFYSIAVSLQGGALISFLFYFLVVFIPEKRKRIIIKSNLKKVYEQIKHDILYQIIFASQKGGRQDLTADSETIEKLMSTEGFKAAFESGREADEGFYAFQNEMSDDGPEFREIILNLQILSNQIEFVLHNYTIREQGIFDFFKRLQIFLMRIQAHEAGYDESKPLCSFIWEIFAGWDFVSGDRGYDIIEKMIEDI